MDGSRTVSSCAEPEDAVVDSKASDFFELLVGDVEVEDTLLREGSLEEVTRDAEIDTNHLTYKILPFPIRNKALEDASIDRF